MSVSAEEESIVELDIQFSGLSISVRGAPDTAARFVQQISSQDGASSAYGPSASPTPVDLHPTGRPRPTPSSAPGRAAGTTSSYPTRASVEASFPPCPASWIGAASARLSGSKSTPTARAQRAWKAGQWARAVQEGRAQSPNRTETIDLPNRIWCVVRGPDFPGPKVYHTSRDFFQAVGDLSRSNTLCHAWPSETEARIYFEGAGQEFPSSS